MLDKLSEQLSQKITSWINTSHAFATACLGLIIWAITGPFVNFSNEWQLIINTGTTIITFLLGFLIARTQAKDSKAIHLKLDEIIATQPGASNRLINIEELNEQQIKQLHNRYCQLKDKIGHTQNSHSIEETEDHPC